MDNNYLLIEILGSTVFYAIRNKDMNAQNIIRKKNAIYLPNPKDDFEKYNRALKECINLIIKKNGYTALRTRVYLRSEFENHRTNIRRQLRDDLYIAIGVNLNLLSYEQELFYKSNQPDTGDNSIICGIAQQELRKVVLCGSFRKYLSKVNEVYQFCIENGIEVLSPQNLHLEDMFNDNFALFHGEHITEERETYLIESKHTDAIKKADAIIVCNPDGYIGSRTLYEIGYADSQNKRIIFLYNEHQDFDICFPRDYGLMGFDL